MYLFSFTPVRQLKNALVDEICITGTSERKVKARDPGPDT